MKLMTLMTTAILIMVLFSKHPLTLIMALILVTTMLAYKTYMMTKLSMLSYAIILVLLGGLIVLFIYMASLAPNETFSTKQNISILIPSLGFMAMIMTHTSPTSPHELNVVKINTLFLYPMWVTTIMVYLLISLIAIVKITSTTSGPLRSICQSSVQPKMLSSYWLKYTMSQPSKSGVPYMKGCYDKANKILDSPLIEKIQPLRKSHPLLKILNSALIDLPAPSAISYWWNLGSLLILCLMIQITTGIFLAMHYSPDTALAFNSISHIMRDVNYGWLLRFAHANGASLFFICIYIHIGRGMYYGSYKSVTTWISGVMILFALMATAFLGYVLPWGQMSFWGATVITNLFSAIPYIGNSLVTWIWGGFSIDNATLTRFFTLHFMLPFILTALILIHVVFLHQKGSNNPLGLNSNMDKIPFHPYFSIKDMLGYTLVLSSFLAIILISPNFFNDPENFNQANPLTTPPHIQPEWYFLFAYAILRSIPNKLGGVLALILSILILAILPLSKNNFQGTQFYPCNQILFWSFITLVVLLTWIGASPIEDPYLMLGQIFTTAYFSFFILNPMAMKFQDNLMNPHEKLNPQVKNKKGA